MSGGRKPGDWERQRRHHGRVVDIGGSIASRSSLVNHCRRRLACVALGCPPFKSSAETLGPAERRGSFYSFKTESNPAVRRGPRRHFPARSGTKSPGRACVPCRATAPAHRSGVTRFSGDLCQNLGRSLLLWRFGAPEVLLPAGDETRWSGIVSQDPAELQAMAAVECHKAATKLALEPESKKPEPFVDPPLDH